MHIELLTLTAIAPSTGAAASALPGDSLTIKNDSSAAGPRILDIRGDHQTAGTQTLIRPTSGHDTTRDYFYQVAANDVSSRLPDGLSLSVAAQETISLSIVGSATTGDVEIACLVMQYPNLRGIDQRMISWDQLLNRFRNLVTISATLSGSAVAAGAYTGEEVLTSESNLLHANTDYAVVGTISALNQMFYLRGPDTGNVKIPLPSQAADTEFSGGYWPRMARMHDQALIPVINSGNKDSTYLGFVSDENAISPVVTLILGELKK